MTLIDRLGGGPEDLVSSIARNIQAVLNTSRGYGSVVRIYGLGEREIYEKVKPMLDAVAADMALQIQTYEPRLSGVSVKFSGRDGTLWGIFTATGMIGAAAQSYRIRWHVVFRNVIVQPSAGA